MSIQIRRWLGLRLKNKDILNFKDKMTLGHILFATVHEKCLKLVLDFIEILISGLYYKPTTIVNDDSRVINKPETSLTDDARVIIYDHDMFIVRATPVSPSIGVSPIQSLSFTQYN